MTTLSILLNFDSQLNFLWSFHEHWYGFGPWSDRVEFAIFDFSLHEHFLHLFNFAKNLTSEGTECGIEVSDCYLWFIIQSLQNYFGIQFLLEFLQTFLTFDELFAIF